MRIFTKDPGDYVRDLNLLDAYRRDAAAFLARMTGQDEAKCRAYVDEVTAEGGELGIVDPEVLALSKETPGNRQPITPKFSEYLDHVVREKHIISPTLAMYTNPARYLSVLSKYISVNIGRRSVSKDEMFQALMAGDEGKHKFKKLEQATFKIKNNALSGAHASPYTILYNKSAHSSLTSTCRSATSYGNASNEKFLMGNRHYWSPDVVTSNMMSIIHNTDLELLQRVVNKYKLHIPTHEETLECVRYSTDLYWSNEKAIEHIYRLIQGLSDLERAAFVYVADLYHLAKHNPELVYSFLDQLSSKADQPVQDPDACFEGLDEDIKILVYLLNAREIDHRGLDQIKEEEPQTYAKIAATAANIENVLEGHHDLISALWVTKNMPASVAHIPTIIRRTAIVSDTDSTIFTVQYWTNWMVGQMDFSDRSYAVAYTMVFLASKLVEHILAMMSANLGIPTEHIHRLAMKNEFFYPVMSLTSRAKHYYAYVSVQEGRVYKELELEKKGVALKNSNCPPQIMAQATQMMEDVLDTTLAGEKISARQMLSRVAGIEQEIQRSILAGEYNYMTTGQIKAPSSYKSEDKSTTPYVYHEMWEEVFAEKYGHAGDPPYSCVKVSVDADNRTKLNAWLARIEDRVVADKLNEWLTKNNKTGVTALLLPEEVVRVSGIPPEVIQGVDVRRLITNITESFYLVLESLGIYIEHPNHTQLVSDHYIPDTTAAEAVRAATA